MYGLFKHASLYEVLNYTYFTGKAKKQLTMLQTQDLTYTYPGGTPLHFPDIRCEKNEHWLLIGQSGTGKTTLLHLLGGLLTPTAGDVQVDDTSLKKLGQGQLDKFRGKRIGIIFQEAHFVKALTVGENLQLAQKLAGLRPDKARAEELLGRLNLSKKYAKKPERLSVGERQRVAIARALINRPSVILADEPTSALDDDNCQEVATLLEEQAKMAEATLLIVTHDNRLKERFSRQIELAVA